MSKVADVIEIMKGLTALELVELKKGIEETFDVSAAPKAIKTAVSKADAEAIKTQIEGIGGKVEIK